MKAGRIEGRWEMVGVLRRAEEGRGQSDSQRSFEVGDELCEEVMKIGSGCSFWGCGFMIL
jgi:hypothetical protein